MRKLILTNLLIVLTLSVGAQIISKSQINPENLYLFGGSMTEYIAPEVSYSKAPKGFKPFYMSHYGRHGSRYLLNTSQYEGPYNTLKEAQRAGVLTPFGETVLERVEIMMHDAEGHLGDLTQKGQLQHRGIANRMVKNFPQIFNNRSHITARSTTSHRVVASMTSALMEFSSLLPKMQIDFNDSDADRYYMNYEDPYINSAKNSREKSIAVSQYNAAHTHPQRLMTELFTDTTFITRYKMKMPARRMPNSSTGNIENTDTITITVDRSGTLYNQLYELAANMQSHDLGFRLDDLFTYDEWYDLFTMNNLYWYSVSAFSPLTGSIVPYGHATLLQDILDKANMVIDEGGTSAHLRYGHDTALFPLLCLMEVNDCAWEVSDLERVAERWVAYNIVHMGSNIQLIFYKNRDNEIIVRVLLNEEEATLPITPYVDKRGKKYSNFYKWEDIENYYQSKLDNFYKIKGEQ